MSKDTLKDSPKDSARDAGDPEDLLGNLKIELVAGNSNRMLGEDIASILKTPLTRGVCRRFADMEVFVEIQENVRGTDVFVIQSTSFPANDNLMELLILDRKSVV